MKYGVANLEKELSAQLNFWEKINKKGDIKIRPFITISREFGCEGAKLGEYLRKILEIAFPGTKWSLFDKNILDEVQKEHKLSQILLEAFEKESVEEKEKNVWAEIFKPSDTSSISIYRKVSHTIRSLARNGYVIIVGRGSVFITQDIPGGIHIRLIAPEKWKIEKIMREKNYSHREAEKFLKKGEEDRKRFLEKYFKKNINEPKYYHFIFNNERIKIEEMAEMIITYIKMRKYI